MSRSPEILNEVREVLVESLGIQSSSINLTDSTELFGNLPELDSMAVITLIAAIEKRFSISIDDDDVNGDVFETLGSLADFVEGRLAKPADA